MKDNNGFSDALDKLKTVVDVTEKVAEDSLDEAANYFAEKLENNIPASAMRKGSHLKDNVKVTKKGDVVTVGFEDEGWYWFLVDKGHKKRGGKGRVPGAHFVQNTLSAEDKKITEILTSKIMKKLGGK